MDLTNILLWAFSLSLALIGISFGVIASINSAKANRKIQDLIQTTFVAEESQKFLFENMKKIITFNRKTLRSLGDKITYSDYSLAAGHTRFHILSKATIDVLTTTEYKDVIKTYLDSKKVLDRRFTSIIDLKQLHSNEFLSKKTQNELKEYHSQVIEVATNIIKAYTLIVSSTAETSMKK